MLTLECSRDGCGRKPRSRGFCASHYVDWLRKEGRWAEKEAQYSDPEEAFASRTRRDGDCIVWTGAISSRGYGQITVSGRNTLAHRYAWERINGAIPGGMVIDHKCWNRACVNVEHLRLATQAQNNQNLSGPRSDSASGVRGVRRKGSKWEARVEVNGRKHSSTHDTLENAAGWASAMRRELMPFSQEEG